MDYLKIDRFHLLGTAAGGFVAWDYALSFPKRLRSLVVANSIGGVQDPEYQEAMQRLRTPDFSRCLQTCVSWDPRIACPTRLALNDGENWSEPRGRPARSRRRRPSAIA